MAIYTTEVRTIVEELNDSEELHGGDDVETLITAAIPKIFDAYPIFDESYRSELNKKIVRHFYTREIGYETYGLWKFKLNTKMKEIMPYYNKLYNSELIKFDPLIDTITDTQRSRNESYESSDAYSEVRGSNQKSSGNSKNDYISQDSDANKFMDTPQSSIEGTLTDNYMTSANVVDKNGSGKSNTEHSTTIDTNGRTDNTNTKNAETNEGFVERIAGLRGFHTQSKLLMEFRDSFLNIDMMVIKDLESLFMGIW